MLKNPELRGLLVSIVGAGLEGTITMVEKTTAELPKVPNAVAREAEGSIRRLTDFVTKHPDLDKIIGYKRKV